LFSAVFFLLTNNDFFLIINHLTMISAMIFQISEHKSDFFFANSFA